MIQNRSIITENVFGVVLIANGYNLEFRPFCFGKKNKKENIDARIFCMDHITKTVLNFQCSVDFTKPTMNQLKSRSNIDETSEGNC